jgi:succinoglycan biosynthesis protein ExoM
MRHIAVCICTFRRLDLLGRALKAVGAQQTDGRFTFSIVVADNDKERSGEPVVEAFRATSAVPVVYCVEPRQNIAHARNKAVENAQGDFITFIDDDEFPIERWLLSLLETCDAHNADGVLGPVRPHFDRRPPKWIVAGRFFDRPAHPTGMVIEWRNARTGNVLLKRQLFEGLEEPFNPEFLSGEDQDFFRRMTGQGRVFVWCEEAVAYEVIPPVRWTRSFMIRRAMMRGVFSARHRATSVRSIGESVVAAPIYAAALPFALVGGQGRFMACSFKLSYHVGRLLAAVGINPIKGPYVTE